jgi:hypothetical protein
MLAKRIIWLSLLALLAGPVPSVLGQTPAVNVGGPNANFSSIQAAINAAAKGGVHLRAARYLSRAGTSQ